MLYQLSYARVGSDSSAGAWPIGRNGQETRLASPGFAQPVAGREKVLRQHLHVSEHRHEAGVARPPGHDVKVHMVDDSCACEAAQVPTEVESRRRVRRAQRLDSLQPEPVNLERGVIAQLAELAQVSVRGDQEMARRVRELVQEHERVLAAADDERGLDLAGGLGAEDAFGLLVGVRDVFEAPRRPQRLRHRFDLLNFGGPPADHLDVSSIAAKPTCVVADDHLPVLESIARYLGAHGYRVVGLARNGADAVTLIESLRPSVAVLDLRMPALSGAAVVRQVTRTTPQCGSVVYSGFGDAALVDEALDAGARGFVLKDAPLEALVRALQTVAGGGMYIDPALADASSAQ